MYKISPMSCVFFQHFVCAKCEKPFLGTRHYEKKGLAYCEIHYHQVNTMPHPTTSCLHSVMQHWLGIDWVM